MALIISLMNTMISVIIVHMQYHPRSYHDTAILHVSWMKVISWLNCRVNEIFATNYVIRRNKDFDQYGPYAISAKLIPCCSHSTSLISQNAIFIVIASSFGTNCILDTNYVLQILFNMVHTQHDTRLCHINIFCKFGESKCNPYCVIVLTSESRTNYVFKRTCA